MRKFLAGVMSAVMIAMPGLCWQKPQTAQAAGLLVADGQRLLAPEVREPQAIEKITEITDFSRFANDYAYEDMAGFDNKNDRRALYADIQKCVEEFWTSDRDLVAQSDGTYLIDTVNLSQYQLTIDDVVETFFGFKEDNPIFYYMSNMLHIKGVNLYLYADGAFAKAADRKRYQKEIIDGLNEFIEETNGMTTDFDILLEVHDKIVDRIDYAYLADGVTPSSEAWAHSIIGYFDDNYLEGVCECYARTYALVLNMLGLENVYVTGVANSEDHVWNIVKLEGNYYYIDCTWDDTGDMYDYFLKGNNSAFKTDHTANQSTARGVDYLYDLPQISAADYVYRPVETILIDSVRDIKRLVLCPEGSYRFTKDVDFTGVKTKNANISQYMELAFNGTIDGDGHKISGLRAGLFESIGEKGQVNNLNLEADYSGSACTEKATKFSAVKYTLAQENRGLIKNCTLSYALKDLTGMGNISAMNIAGFVRNNYGSIEDSEVTMTMTSDFSTVNHASVGGVAFNNYGSIHGCKVNMSVNNTAVANMYLGGMAAMSLGNSSLISHCTVEGSVFSYENSEMILGGMVPENNGIIEACESNVKGSLSSSYSGGITGMNNFMVKSSINRGELSGSVTYFGGIAGYNKGLLIDCTNSGNVYYAQGSRCVGGITGMTGTRCVISGCSNIGNVAKKTGNTETAAYTGGVIGRIPLNTGNTYDANNNLIVNVGYVFVGDCTNSGSIGGDNNGAIVGLISVAHKDSQVILKNCTNTGTIAGKSKDTLSGETQIYPVAVRNSKIPAVLVDNTKATGSVALSRKRIYVNAEASQKIDQPDAALYLYYSGEHSAYANGTVQGMTEGFDLLVVYNDAGEFDYEVIIVGNGDAVWYGDADQNGVIDVADLVLLKKYLAGYTVELQEETGDADGDGRVTSADVVLVAKYLAGYEVELGGH